MTTDITGADSEHLLDEGWSTPLEAGVRGTIRGFIETLLEEELQHPVRRLQSGPLGGDQQLGALIAQGEVDLLVFFWDPLEAQPHDPDVKALIRLAVVWNIPVACNRATADFLVSSPLMTGSYVRATPDFDAYLNRFSKPD